MIIIINIIIIIIISLPRQPELKAALVYSLHVVVYSYRTSSK